MEGLKIKQRYEALSSLNTVFIGLHFPDQQKNQYPSQMLFQHNDEREKQSQNMSCCLKPFQRFFKGSCFLCQNVFSG